MMNNSVSTAMQFEGMTSVEGLTLMNVFLGKVKESYESGLCIEFGAYKGRTAALIASTLGEKNWLHAIEQADYLQINDLMNVSSSVTWHKERSESFCSNVLPSLVGEQKIIYTHHDASHFFSNVYTEVTSILDYMAPKAVMVLDDFNDNFPQVRAAYYYARYKESFPYELLLVGFNKAILVHEDAFDFYEEYMLSSFIEDMNTNGISCKLVRSDVNRHARSFFVRTKKANEDTYYGLSFWGDRFYQKSSEILLASSLS